MKTIPNLQCGTSYVVKTTVGVGSVAVSTPTASFTTLTSEADRAVQAEEAVAAGQALARRLDRASDAAVVHALCSTVQALGQEARSAREALAEAKGIIRVQAGAVAAAAQSLEQVRGTSRTTVVLASGAAAPAGSTDGELTNLKNSTRSRL